MARTRSTKSAPATKAEASDASSTTAKYALPDESSNAPKLFIVPQKATKEARIVSLPNPRYSKPTRYLTCPETGLYEFTKIAAPKTSPRSWMIETSISALESNDSKECKFEAHITNGADLFIATPIDPLFILLPGLFGSANAKSNDAKRLFLSSDDHLDALDTSSSHLAEALRCPNTRALLESRMEAVCDTVDAGDEKMYRLSEQKLVREVLAKARSMGLGGLPASMEEKFVKKALEAPIQVQKSQAATAGAKSVADEAAGETSTPTPKLETEESQTSTSTVDSTQSALSQASTAATEYVEETVVSAILASDEVVGLQRLRVAFNFICSSYIAPETTATLKKMLSDEDMTGVDFAPLDDYLAQLTKLRAEAASSRSMADYSRKRMLDEEEEEARAEKKRRVEEDKKKKATQSRGIKVLEKVNTKGMKKMSDFFKKK